MNHVFWTHTAENKLLQYKSKHFTLEETNNYVIKIMSEIEHLLLNPHLSKRYTEEYGEFKEMSRLFHRRFRIYYETVNDHIVVLAIKTPGEF